ncbi:MAG: alpha/beta hydrolase [Microcystis flos-aquae TF09]|uniref:Alpha/beta hydrolase n=1 Tax=Microcystis flos-aquae TF09 TaxID=2060473 RepID=A0A3E0KTJ3_9CHRO|nr:MAG: alpha/beta hydrolase [Microcystis flos-aquae TF09]
MEERDKLIEQLPLGVRQAYERGKQALDEEINKLSDEERAKVYEILRQLAELESKFFSPPIEELEDLSHASELPTTFFKSEEEEESFIVPSPEEIDETKRGVTDGKLYPVWFATNRKPKNLHDVSQGFAGERDPNKKVYYGVARVNVPKSCLLIEQQNPWRAFWGWNSDKLRLLGITNWESSEFWNNFKSELSRSEKGEVLLYVHGYRTDFAAAMCTAAQLGYNLEFSGLTACYSWPSLGTTQGYVADGDSAEFSVDLIADFIQKLVDVAGGGKVHLIVHSMGNRATLNAIDRLINRLNHTGLQLGQIILAAPDVDSMIFRSLAGVYTQVTNKQITLYTSSKDDALSLSEIIHGYPRAGKNPPFTVVNQINTIDVGAIDMSSWGHAYITQTERVIEDINKVIYDNCLPNQGRGLDQKSTAQGETYWSFRP